MFVWESQDVEREKCIKNLRGYKVTGNEALLRYEEGMVRLRLLSEDIFRVTFTWKNSFLEVPSFAVINETREEDFSVDEDAKSINFKTKKLLISISRENGGITVSDYSGRIISQDVGSGFTWTKDTVTCKKKMKAEDHFYGLGEKTGFLDKKGKRYVNWNTDEPLHTPAKDPLYKTIPFLMHFNDENTYGIFMDKTCKSWFDLGEQSEEYFTFEADDFEMDYYFISGNDLKQIIGKYTGLTGRIYLPPKWALGYQQCRWSYFPDNVVMDIAEKFREKKIPCDVIYLDIDYMDEYRVFTWSQNRFPNPEKMLEELREKGFKVVTIVDPGVKKDAEYDVYMEGVRKDLFCKLPTGEVYHGKVWPGDAAFPDFSKEETRKWWGEKHEELLGKGVAGIWNDMNEPSDFSGENSSDRTLVTVPNDVMMENDGHPRSFRRYHNTYGFNMCKGTYEGFKKLKPNERPFMVTRSAYAGIQRYSSVWTGDNHSWWEHLASSMPMHMNLGLSGVPFVGGDVGGFQDKATPELFARWMQLGAFTPFFRGHADIWSKAQEPWSFGKEVEDISRKYIELRYKLMPYNYNEFYKASRTGLPIMRPLVLEYPGDANVHNLCDQFLYGESIMLAPVYRPSTDKRCVYIPEGTWYDYWTEEKIKGSSHIIADAPMDILPMYIKAGSIIPSCDIMNYVGEKSTDSLTLDIYSGADVKYSLYEDDGLSNEYKEGTYSITEFELLNEDCKLTLRIKPVKNNYATGRNTFEVKIHGIGSKPSGIICDGKFIEEYEAERDVLTVKMQDKKVEQSITICF